VKAAEQLGHLTFFPAAVAGSFSLRLQEGQADNVTVGLAGSSFASLLVAEARGAAAADPEIGTAVTAWHFGHLTFLPRAVAGIRIGAEHWLHFISRDTPNRLTYAESESEVDPLPLRPV
jgi:hypothetical protein